MSGRKDDSLRIGMININGLPDSNTHAKNHSLYNALMKLDPDIMGLAETNQHWRSISSEHQWRNRTLSWWETSHSTIAFNTKDIKSSSSFQPGGVILQSINKAVHRIIQSGKDPSGLGRWAWTLYRGKQNMTLRVVCAYRPCVPSSLGVQTTFAQHQRVFDAQGRTRNPRQAILDDLGTAIKQWQEEGDQIVLLMDCNAEVGGSEVQDWIINLDLRESITTRHDLGQEVSTYQRGQNKIDGIFTSHAIEIKQCGYLPFDYFPSDHRGLWIDVNYTKVFGFLTEKSVRPNARRLKTNDANVVRKWQQVYSDFLEEHGLMRRQFELESSIQGRTMTSSQIQEYNTIVTLRTAGMDRAEKKCRKLKMGNVPFSPILELDRKKISLWTAVRKKKLGCKSSTRNIIRLGTLVGIDNPVGYSLDAVNKNLQQAKKDYYLKKPKAQELRNKFLEQRAIAMAESSGNEKQNIYKQLLTQENQRRVARKIRLMKKEQISSGITKVDILRPDGSRETHSSKEEIEEICLEENKRKFLQTNDTPCMQEPLYSLLGLGTTVSCEEILSNTFRAPANTDQYTRELLHCLRRHPDAPQNYDTVITKEVFQEGWMKMKERTSAGISGIHFGQMKACAQTDHLSNFEASISNVAYTTGVSPLAWEKGVNVMIHKKSHEDLVTKLRTIVLTEADFNFNNKVLGRSTIYHAERHQLLPDEQYGSRPNKCAIDHAIHKRLTYDILRQMKQPGALCSNDAKSCYDRVVHSIACMAYKRLGIPEPPVISMLTTIKNMKHHIRTNYGDSTFFMDNNGSLRPFQGILQGNGAAPTTWVVISAVLIQMLKEAGNGGFFKEPIAGLSYHITGFAFVDDTDLIALNMRDHNITEWEVLEEMQECINRWQGGLWASGGAIVPEKSFVYPIAFNFNEKGEWRYKTLQEVDYSFTVKDHTGQQSDLPQKECNMSSCTLGVELAPDGNNDAMVASLRQKAEEWGSNVRSGHLNRHEAWLALNSTIMRSLLYPLPALTLTEEQCTKIMAPVIAAGLNCLGVSSKMPRKIVYGNKDEFGLGITNLYHYQGTERIAIINKQVDQNTITGKLIRTTIEAAKIEIGSETHFFQLDYKDYSPLLTECWIKDIWKFAHEQNIHIIERRTMKVEKRSSDDVMIMDACVELGYSKADLQKINRCRLFLQVMTLQDVRVLGSAGWNDTYKLQRPEYFKSKLTWPKQSRPSRSISRLWRQALRRIKELYPDPLRSIHSTSHLIWLWFYDPLLSTLYQKIGNVWRKWVRANRRGRLGSEPLFKYECNAIRLPTTSQLASVRRLSPHKVQLTGWLRKETTHPQEAQKITRISTHLTEEENQEQFTRFLNDMIEEKVNAVCDGSYFPDGQTGTAAWIMESQNSSYCRWGRTQTPGESGIQNAYRSELFGIVALMAEISHISKEHTVQASIAIGCDNRGAVEKLNNLQIPVSSNTQHFDLLQMIQQIMQRSQMKFSFYWIKSHQDEQNDLSDLTRSEYLNVLVDSMAKSLNRVIQSHENLYYADNLDKYRESTIQWTNPYTNDRTQIRSQLGKTLRQFINSKRTKEYICYKKKINLSDFYKVDWNQLQSSLKGSSRSMQIWLSKWITGFMGTGRHLSITGYQAQNSCPRCSLPETIDHILQCQADSAITLWKTELELLVNDMLQRQGCPQLILLLRTHLEAWYNRSQAPSLLEYARPYQSLIIQQSTLGWSNMFHGLLSTHWHSIQKTYLTQIGARTSPSRWMATLQRRIWMIAWKMWRDRNHCLHETEQSEEMQDINEALTKEHEQGISGLPSTYAHLFTSHINTLLQQDPDKKKKWLATVWSARENQSGTLTHRDPTIPYNNFYLRWRIQADPDRAVAERRRRQRQAKDSRRRRGTRPSRQSSRQRPEVEESSTSGSEIELESN